MAWLAKDIFEKAKLLSCLNLVRPKYIGVIRGDLYQASSMLIEELQTIKELRHIAGHILSIFIKNIICLMLIMISMGLHQDMNTQYLKINGVVMRFIVISVNPHPVIANSNAIFFQESNRI